MGTTALGITTRELLAGMRVKDSVLMVAEVKQNTQVWTNGVATSYISLERSSLLLESTLHARPSDKLPRERVTAQIGRHHSTGLLPIS